MPADNSNLKKKNNNQNRPSSLNNNKNPHKRKQHKKEGKMGNQKEQPLKQKTLNQEES